MGGVVLLTRPLSLLGTIALARLLDPTDFGQVALVLVLLGTSHLFVGLGMAPAVVHSEKETSGVSYHAFIVTLISGIIIFSVLFLNAGWVVSILGDVDVDLFRHLLPLVLITALSIVPDALLQKSLLFGRISLAGLISDFSYFVVTIILALLDFGVWSLVYGRLASALILMILTWAFNPNWVWLKRTIWDWSLLKDLMSYGLRSTGSGTVAYFHSHWDDWFVGRHFGSQSLGYYSKSYDLSNSTLSTLSGAIVAKVFFPTYTRIRNDHERTKHVYLRSLQFVLLMMTPLALGLLVLAPEIVEVLLGPKWLPMTNTLMVFCIMALMLPVSRNAVPVFQAMGRPQYNLYAGIVLSIVMVPLILLLAPYEIVGVAVAVVISHTIGAAFNVYLLETLLPGTLWPTIRMSLLYLMLGGVMVLAVALMKPVVGHYVGDVASLLSLIILVGIGAITYCGLALITQKELILELIDLAKIVLNRGEQTSTSVVQEVGN